MNSKTPIMAFALFSSSLLYGVEMSALLKYQGSFNYLESDWQKQELQLDVEFNEALGEGDLTAITRLVVDGREQLNSNRNPSSYSSIHGPRYTHEHGMAEVRELYWEYSGDFFWKIGKQQVVWGEADGLKLLDVVNPQSYREFILDDFEDSRIPLWMIKAEMQILTESELQLLWIPDATTHDLAHQNSPYALRSPLLVPVSSGENQVTVREPQTPGKILQDSDVGLRFSTFLNGWDITFNYLYHYIDTPVLRSRVSGDAIIVDSDYERSHLIGGSASSVMEDWTLRAEVAYETNRYYRTIDPLPGVTESDQLGFVIGLDYQGWSDQFVSFQWFQTHILDPSKDLYSASIEDVISLLWDVSFMNETLNFRVMHLYSLDHHDGLLRPKVTYNLLSNLDLVLSMDRFFGNSEGIFGQFDQADRISFGFELGLD